MLLILFDRLISRTRSVTDLFADHSDLMDLNEKYPQMVPAIACKNEAVLKCAVCSILWLEVLCE